MLNFLIVCFYRYGLIFIGLLLLIKVVILYIYKPKDKEYIVKHIFTYHHAYKVRREDFLRWRKFRIILNSVTVIIHLSIAFFIASQIFYESFSNSIR